MNLKLLTHPNNLLRQKSVPVKKFDDKLKRLAGAMHFYMLEWKGLGLSAVQVGRPIQLMTINTMEYDGGKFTITNPVILNMDGEYEYNEGCLSFPEKFISYKRPGNIQISYQDLNGATCFAELKDLTAFCFLHEYDHFQGKLLIDLEKEIYVTKKN